MALSPKMQELAKSAKECLRARIAKYGEQPTSQYLRAHRYRELLVALQVRPKKISKEFWLRHVLAQHLAVWPCELQDIVERVSMEEFDGFDYDPAYDALLAYRHPPAESSEQMQIAA